MPEPILLILDLDETLIHATTTLLERPADFQVYHYHVYKRPGLDAFLEQVAAHFRLAVWSSASDDYIRAIVTHILLPAVKLEFVWGRSRCTPFLPLRLDEEEYVDFYQAGGYEYAKRLKKVRRRGYNLRRVLIVDDTPAKVQQHYGNAIYPTPFVGQSTDQELPQLAAYLLALSTADNVRSIEKRYWRNSL